MSWVDRLAEAVGGRPLDSAPGVEWAAIESRIGIALPADYKEFCEAFGPGEFCDYLTVHASAGGADSELADSQEANLRMAEQHPVVLDGYLPYGIHRPGGQGGGILQWGVSQQGEMFAWLADPSAAPETWPVLLHPESGEWRRYDMSMSELTYRLLADESFEEFGTAGVIDPPYFTRRS
ncbi:SMI1/KNR4 family protein [Streptomyces sp. NPDC054802]